MTIAVKTLAKSITSGCAVAALITSSAAMAQSTDSATAQATADFQIETPPLTVAATSDLQFATVNIPNGAVAGNQCEYILPSSSGTTFVSVAELDSQGGFVSAVSPTPSGCAKTGSHAPARFAITCTVATPTNVSLSVDGLLEGSGVVLTSNPGTKMTAVEKDSNFGALVFSSTETMEVACPEGESAGDALGAFDVVVGGYLLLSELATPGSDITVGTITVTASY